jgi:hypothetical protein
VLRGALTPLKGVSELMSTLNSLQVGTSEFMKDLERYCLDKAVLTVQDVAKLLECDPKVIQNWAKRSDPKRRPPRLIIGKEVRFPTKAFCAWLSKTQTTKC